MRRRSVAVALACGCLLAACAGDASDASTAAPPRRGVETMWWRRIDVQPVVTATSTTIVEPTTTVAEPTPTTAGDTVPSAPVTAPGSTTPATTAPPTSGEGCVARIHAPGDVLFAPRSATVERAGADQLAALVATAFAGATHVEVDGATDSRGNEQDNLALSAARAAAVADVLVSHGFDSTAITTVALGEDHPVADEHGPDPASAQALNRRVELIATVPCPPTSTQST